MTDVGALRASVAERAKVDRDFNYIKPSGKRLSEYEAVNLYVQVEQGLFGSDGWFVKGHEGRDPWRAESTRLSHPHWFDFRDPARLWQRTHTRLRAEEERAIERVTQSAIETDALADIDPGWLSALVHDHYRAWSFAEYGIFRPFASAQREALSDTLGSVCVFTGLDRLRHAQSIVIWLMELETHLPGFNDEGGKERWLSDPIYQPARKLIEKIMFEQWDWGELAVAVNLVLDPIVNEVALFGLLRRNGPFHGDLVTPVIVGSAERDRSWSLGWAESLVKLVTAEEVPDAKQNRAVIQEWIDTYTPLAVEAAEALAPVYDQVPRLCLSFDEVLAGARSKQRGILEGLGLDPGGQAMSSNNEEGRRVALVLMKSPEADATLDVVRADCPELEITDHTSYWKIQGEGEISIDLARVAEELGEPITMSQWLVTMSSYIGRVSPDDQYFRVTSDMLQLG